MDHSFLEHAVLALQRGGVVAFPTETVYGIGCSMLCEKAIERVYMIKGRDKTKPLSLLLVGLFQVPLVASAIPDSFYLLAKRFLPGPLAVVLKKHPLLSSSITSGRDSVAIRISSHPIAQKLVAMVGSPLATTSANLSGRPSLTSGQLVAEQLGEVVDFVVEGGETEYGVESTILSLEDPQKPRCLRVGAIPIDLLAAYLQQTISL